MFPSAFPTTDAHAEMKRLAFIECIDLTGYSQNEFGRKLGCSGCHVSQCCSGDRPVSEGLLWAALALVPERRRGPVWALLSGRLNEARSVPAVGSMDAETDEAVDAMLDAVATITKAKRNGIQFEECDGIDAAMARVRAECDDVAAVVRRARDAGPQGALAFERGAK